MLKTNKQIKQTIFTAIFAVLMVPTLVLADRTGSYDSGSWNGNSGWGDWGGNSSTYDYTYTPNYSYTPSYSSPSYSSPSYSSNYGTSYTPSSYTPSYSGSSYGGYTLPSYGSSYSASSIPSSNYVANTSTSNNANDNTNANNNSNTSSSNSTSSSSAIAVNNNVNNNNVYVYTNPTGNAVVHNPGRVILDGYCVITPSNPRTGQTVTATAYATGGIGNYTYTWGGDINTVSGASTSFTSYTTGIKYINVTIRSDQEIITKTCTVTFENNNYVYGNYNTSYTGGSSVNLTPGITSGTPVSGVYLSQLPATGLSLSFFDYMIATMVVILGAVFTFVYQTRKRLTLENI